MFDKMKLWKNNNDSIELQERIDNIKAQPIPEHVAIIMDGNGRWAKKERCHVLQVIMKGQKSLERLLDSPMNSALKR